MFAIILRFFNLLIKLFNDASSFVSTLIYFVLLSLLNLKLGEMNVAGDPKCGLLKYLICIWLYNIINYIVNKRTTSITDTIRQCNFWKKKITKCFQIKYCSEFLY